MPTKQTLNKGTREKHDYPRETTKIVQPPRLLKKIISFIKQQQREQKGDIGRVIRLGSTPLKLGLVVLISIRIKKTQNQATTSMVNFLELIMLSKQLDGLS